MASIEFDYFAQPTVSPVGERNRCCACGGNAAKSGRFYISDDVHDPESPDDPVAEPICRKCVSEKDEWEAGEDKQLITGRQKSRIEKYFAEHGREHGCEWPRWLQEILYSGNIWYADGEQTVYCADQIDDRLEWECKSCGLEMLKSRAEELGGWLTTTWTRQWQGKPVELVEHYCSACRWEAVANAAKSRGGLHDPRWDELGFSSWEAAIAWIEANRALDAAIGKLDELKEDTIYPWTPFEVQDCDPVNALA